MRGRMFLTKAMRDAVSAQPRNGSAPAGALLQYFGGRIVSNIQVVQVLYGAGSAGSYIPQVTSTASPSMATFYQGVLNSPYVDWLTEYNTNNQPSPNSNQTLGRGSFGSQVTITPAAANNGTVIDDTQIQAEISAQIAAGNIPAPVHDAAGNNNTYYALFFPHGKTITLGGSASCQVFCAYHGTIANAGGAGEIEYGVHPDFQPGSGCEFGCGAAATQFGNYTQVASHELVETMTDPEIGLANVIGPPVAWFDLNFNEIGDICNDQNGNVVGSDGLTYDVQTEFSNSLHDCIVTNPAATPIIANGAEVCRGATTSSTVTLLGGAGRFTSNVTLSLTSVTPASSGITATFNPNPVPTPSVNGSTSTMNIATTATTAEGSYTLGIQGASTGFTASTTAALTVRSAVPSGPTLQQPPNGNDGASVAPTFSWSTVSQATTYGLDIFDGSNCAGTPIRSFTTANTSFTVPANQAITAFHDFSWRVSAANSCGNAQSSACFNFRTASCSDSHEVAVNGGFENGLTGWSVDATVPAPVVNGDNPHSGHNAVLLGTVTGSTEPLGDSQISQIFSIGGAAPTLTFQEWPFSNDSVTFDQQYVRVTPISPPGATVVLMNEARDDQAYVARSFDLSQFSGMTVKITFGVHQDGFGDITGMFLDDVSVVSASCGPPEFAVRVAAPAPEEVCAGRTLDFAISVDSVNGPNFTSPVTLSAGRLPPGATATFARNPIGPGETTTMTLTTVRPTVAAPYDIDVTGVAVTPPPSGPRTTTTTVVVDANAPTAPELVSPRPGEVNTPRRPTLSWTAPFVPDSVRSGSAIASSTSRALYPWEMAATTAPRVSKTATGASIGVSGASGPNALSLIPFAFGASGYHVQVARDAAFTQIVADATIADTSFTVPADLDIATQYFWRVSASNACGGSAFSATGSFIVGACFEDWVAAPAVPITAGPSQGTVVASPGNNTIYVIGGATGPGPSARINELWAFDGGTQTWTHKTDVPSPGVGANFGSAALLGGTIYVFGGINGPPGPVLPHRVLWRYNIASNTWSRGADLPTDNFGAAVAAIGGKLYIAYGSGFTTQTWEYNPVTDSYTRKADAPSIPTTNRVHGAAVGGELHAFAGGFEGRAHVIFNPATNTWRLGPAMPFTATDPAVSVIGGRIMVVGGRPIAHTQIFDPASGTWSQATPIVGAATGVDNTSGAALGSSFHLVGGFDGANSTNTHWQFHTCNAGGLSSAAFLPFVTDGDGRVTGIGDERTSLLLDNQVSGTAMTVSAFLYGSTGNVLGTTTFAVAPNELKTITDVVRALTHTTTAQNSIGSLALFGTEVFQATASVVNNSSADPIFEDGQSLNGGTSGFLSTVGTSAYTTQAVFANPSTGTSVVNIVAYPAAGGDIPAGAIVAIVPAHGTVSFPDVVHSLSLPTTFVGQLSWSASRPVNLVARNMTRNRSFSGIEPSLTSADVRTSVLVPYVEDTTEFSTALELSNPGLTTANVTVHFFESSDLTGSSDGVDHARDIPVASNSALPIADVVRFARRDTGTAVSGKRGFMVVTSPQGVVAQARIVNRASLDPVVPDSNVAVTSGFSPVLIRVDPFATVTPEFMAITAAAATSSNSSRVALSNPNATPVTVQLAAFNATGSLASSVPFVVTLAPNGQFFSDNLARDMGLPPVFFGSVSVQSSAPVLVYNHRRAGSGGGTLPVHAQ